MKILLSCAKTITNHSRVSTSHSTYPTFIKEANALALQISQYSVEELGSILRVNSKIAKENFHRFQNFHADATLSLQAILAYTGIVFKHINPTDFTTEDFNYAQKHLLITSFLYGLLRPLDLIRPYRLEGDVRLPENNGITQFDYWKPLLTEWLIQEVEKDDGILLNLASAEMRNLFEWNKITDRIKVITPEFQIWKGNKLTTIVIYTKMCRGEMTRYILKNRINKISQLKNFEWEGFHIEPYNTREDDTPLFVL